MIKKVGMWFYLLGYAIWLQLGIKMYWVELAREGDEE